MFIPLCHLLSDGYSFAFIQLHLNQLKPCDISQMGMFLKMDVIRLMSKRRHCLDACPTQNGVKLECPVMVNSGISVTQLGGFHVASPFQFPYFLCDC